MKQASIHKYIAALLLVVAIAAMAPQPASAAGTTSGTTINNAASVVYTVGSVTQPLYTGPTTTFAVDTKVIFNVSKSDGAPIQVAPGDNTSSTVRRLSFSLRNDSNASIRFQVSAANLTSGLTVTFGATPYADNLQTFSAIPTACFDVNANNVCDVNEDFLIVNADTTEARIIVNGDVATNANNGDIIGAILTATAVDGTGATLVETAVPGINTVDIVLADGTGSDDAARSATYTDRSAWQVSAALLAVTKAAAVYSDPVNLTTNPKAIPGAVLTYTITITNGPGGATATNITISDSLAAEIGAGHVAFAPTFHDAVNACVGAQGIVVNGVCSSNAGATTDWNVTAANTVTVSGLTLAPNTTAVVKFQVTIL